MARSEHYNQYPEGFLEDFKEPVTFKLVGIKPDPDNKSGFLMPTITSIPPESKVSFTDKDGKTHLVRLALISSIDAEGNIAFDDRRLFIGQINNGEIKLDPKRSRDLEVWRYLHHCHWNASSPYAEEDGPHVVFEYNWEAEANKEISGRSAMFHAFKFISSAEDEDINHLYNMIGTEKSSKIGPGAMRNELEKLAISDPSTVSFAISQIEMDEDKSDVKQKAVDHNEGDALNEDGLDEGGLDNNTPPEPPAPPAMDTKKLAYEAKNLGALKQVNNRMEFTDPQGKIVFKWSKRSDTEERSPIDQLSDAMKGSQPLRDQVSYLINSQKSRV